MHQPGRWLCPRWCCLKSFVLFPSSPTEQSSKVQPLMWTKRFRMTRVSTSQRGPKKSHFCDQEMDPVHYMFVTQNLLDSVKS